MSTKMYTKKKDLEIIFNLQWKYGPKVAERSNIVGVYDIPSTTLNWEPFKSYILKNSGTPGNDVKVSYIKDGNEIPIESTLGFQTALYFFRNKAMNGEVINLKLERLSNGNKSHKLTKCDAQTECREGAPEWFTNYMAEFKKEILSEVASAVTMHTAAIRSSLSHPHYTRKSKSDCSKRCRKPHHHDGNEKEVLKTLKMEKKLESKMEKLVNKSKKLKEKKLSLVTKSSDSDAGHSSSKSNSESVLNVDISLMNAAPLRCEEPKIPHFMGGEVYRHCWAVINNGLAPWTVDTELHFSWGSSLLQPIQKVIPCPLLNPMESGEIEALIHVPKICGKYQMYWHFYHKGRKFGQWLGCEIIVDKINQAEMFSGLVLRNFDPRYDLTEDSVFLTPWGSIIDKDVLKTEEKSPSEKTEFLKEVQKRTEEDLKLQRKESEIPMPPISFLDDFDHITISNQKINDKFDDISIYKSPSKIQIYEKKNEIAKHFEKPNESNDANDSEEISDKVNLEIHIIENYMREIGRNTKKTCEPSTSGDGNFTRDEADSHSESISKIDEDTSSNSTLNDIVMVNFPEEIEELEKPGYAYVFIDGVKTAVPKKFLRQDFLETAEDAPEPKKFDVLRHEHWGDMQHPFDIELNHDYINEKMFDSIDDDDDDIPDLESANGTSCVTAQDISNRPYTSPEFEVVNKPDLDEVQDLLSSDSEVEVCTVQTPNKLYKFKLTNGPHHLKELDQSPYAYHEIMNSSSDMPPPVSNNTQKPLELKPKTNVNTQDAPTNSKIMYSSKEEAITINPALNGAIPRPQVKDSPTEVPTTSSDSKVPRSSAETPVPIATVVSEAMTMASSALKNVVNKIIPSKNEAEPGVWLSGHWVPTVPNSIREKNLKTLADMGFINRDLNATLLARYNDDVRRVVTELVQ